MNDPRPNGQSREYIRLLLAYSVLLDGLCGPTL